MQAAQAMPYACRLVAAFLIMACDRPIEARGQDPAAPAAFDYTGPTITAERARELAATWSVITLVHVRELPTEVARSLVGNERAVMLSLPAVESLDADTARELGRFQGSIRLWGLKTLTPDVARALSESKINGELDLRGLADVSHELAGILGRMRVSSLWLGVREIDVELVRALVPLRGRLNFPDLETLSPEAAAAFAGHAWPLDLGVVRLSRETATALLAHKHALSFTGLRRLEPGVGEILARHEREVAILLSGMDCVPLARKIFRQPGSAEAVGALTTITPEIARELVRSGANVSMLRLQSLTPEAARELARKHGDMVFFALQSISPDTARALTDRPASEFPVYLPGITSLEGPDAGAVAESLASTSGAVNLGNLERVSARALAVLRTKATIALPADDKLTIIP